MKYISHPKGSENIPEKHEYDGFDHIEAHANYPCMWCKKEIVVGDECYRRNNNMRFCSEKCVEEWLLFREMKKEGIVAISKKPGKCGQCGKVIPIGWYHWYDRENKYCSEECFELKKSTARKPSGKFGTTKCEICGEEYPKMIRNQKYCSSRCYRKTQQKGWEK